MTIKAVDLFCGVGGLTYGLQKAGIPVVAGIDIDDSCEYAYTHNNNCTFIHKSVEDVTGKEIRALLRGADVKILVGCAPCQPFSTAGKRLGINDPRGSLFMDFIRMIDYIRPRFFVMENVKGIMSSPLKHVPLSERDESDPEQKLGTVLDVILSEFDKLGYKTVYGVLDAVNYGVPQFRERFVLIGSRDDEEIFLPIPTHFQMHQDKKYQWQTVRSAIEDLEFKNGECATLSEERLKFLKTS